LIKELQDKQELCCQASKALELLDEEKSNDLKRSQMENDELNQKIEALQHEVNSLQNALVELNKSTVANDTGYADFLGAVDNKDVEIQRAMMELNEREVIYKQQLDDMNEKIKDLQSQKKDIELKASNLLYENDEMKDKLVDVEKKMNDQVSKTTITNKLLSIN
jgi:chromosome segregation ATPase